MCDVGGAAGGEGAAGCNDKNKNPTIECAEKEGSKPVTSKQAKKSCKAHVMAL